MKVAKIRYNDKDAPAAFTKSLRETGFGVIVDHPINHHLCNYLHKIYPPHF